MVRRAARAGAEGARPRDRWCAKGSRIARHAARRAHSERRRHLRRRVRTHARAPAPATPGNGSLRTMLTKTPEDKMNQADSTADTPVKTTPMTMIQALRSAMDVMMERDENVVVFGQDVGYFGGVFRVTEGLQAKYGKPRCFDAPISEGG